MTLSVTRGSATIRPLNPNLSEQVALSWSRDMSLRTSWEFFTAHWDDFCYPVSDEVLILPDSGGWVLLYQHQETFFFGNRNA